MSKPKSEGKRFVSLRISPETYSRYKAAADRAGVPLANFLLAALNTYFEERSALSTMADMMAVLKQQAEQAKQDLEAEREELMEH